MTQSTHIPVLARETLQALDPKPNENFIDGTLGGGGHALMILKKTAPRGKMLGIDQDANALARAKTLKQERLVCAKGNFRDIKEIAAKAKFPRVSGILLDLGFSSDQLESSGRGFSFQRSEPLDMRLDASSPLTAEKIVNFWSKQDIEKTLKEYGEEQFSKEIAEAITESRKKKQIEKTDQLAKIILNAVPAWYKRQRIHPATKTFQALRIRVNDELEALKTALPQTLELLETKGRLAVISFHSLEDKIVKEFFKQNPAITPIHKKPISASPEEIRKNPRSRSAKLRAGIKTT